LHFGLGGNVKIDTMEIEWPSGSREKLRDLAADFVYTINETTGVRNSNPVTKSGACQDDMPPARQSAPAN